MEASETLPAKRGPGRPRGSPNHTTADLRRLIQRRGAPIEFLCRVVKGKAIQVGDERQIPTLQERIVAATKLMERLVPVPKPEDVPLPDAAALLEASGEDLSPLEAGRRIAFALARAAREAEQAGLTRPKLAVVNPAPEPEQGSAKIGNPSETGKAAPEPAKTGNTTQPVSEAPVDASGAVSLGDHAWRASEAALRRYPEVIRR